jgi:CheY-like chemotaxis protein
MENRNSSRPASRKAIVLLVEDDTDTRESIRNVLVDEGYKVVGVTNGQEAIDYLYKRERPDIIFLDLMMPIMNGWQFLQERQKNVLFQKIPVVVVSAIKFQPETGIDQGHYLPKPLELSQVLNMANRFVSAQSGSASAPH